MLVVCAYLIKDIIMCVIHNRIPVSVSIHKYFMYQEVVNILKFTG